MFFEKFNKIKWERFKLEKFSYEANLTDALYQKIPKETRIKIERFIWQSAISQVRKYLKAKRKEFVTLNGVRIAYLEIGDRSFQDSFVFLHGLGDLKENFFWMAKALSKNFHVIIPDLPGFGESDDRCDLVYSFKNYATWFDQFFEELIGKPFHILGNSLGGAIILQLAFDFPHHFKSLGLLDAAGVVPHHSASFYDEINEGKNLFAMEQLEQFENFLERLFVSVPFVPIPVKHHMFNIFKASSTRYHKILSDVCHGLGKRRSLESSIELALNNRVPEIKLPTFILWGEADSLFPVEVAAMLHTQIRDSKMVILEHIGHCPQIEAPKKVLKRYQKFLDSLSSKPLSC